MLQRWIKVLPFCLIKIIAVKNCERLNISNMEVVEVFDDCLIILKKISTDKQKKQGI